MMISNALDGTIMKTQGMLACLLLCCSSSALSQQAVRTDGDENPAAEAVRAAPANAPIQVRAPAASDTLVLEATSVTGTRELPKVLYIVPWKKAELGELPSQPFNSVLDELLTPLDRDVFRREVTYYDSAPAQPVRQQ